MDRLAGAGASLAPGDFRNLIHACRNRNGLSPILFAPILPKRCIE